MGVTCRVGWDVGCAVGLYVGANVGAGVGLYEGLSVGDDVGCLDGRLEGLRVGCRGTQQGPQQRAVRRTGKAQGRPRDGRRLSVCLSVGRTCWVGCRLGWPVGAFDGRDVGCHNVTSTKHRDRQRGKGKMQTDVWVPWAERW